MREQVAERDPVSTMSSINSTSRPSSGTAVEKAISVWTRPPSARGWR
jgi:hypothetical protein